MFIITLYAIVILSVSCLANPISDVEHLREYVKDIQRQIDDTVKPCENFSKYACGNLKPDETDSISPEKSQLIIQDLIQDADPKTEDEKLIRSFYMSCQDGNDIKTFLKQVDGLKSVPTWPVTRDYSSEEIAGLLGFLTTVDIDGFLLLSIDVVQLNELAMPARSYEIYDKEVLLTTLENFGATSEQAVKIDEDMSDFTNQLRNIETDYTDFKVNNVAELKEAVPNFDWDTFFATVSKELDLDMQEIFKKSVQGDLTKLKKQIDIIKATDSKTVVNFLVWKLLALGLKIDCKRLEVILKPLVVIQNIKEDINYKNFFLQELETFNRFEKSFSEIRLQLNNPESEELKNYMKVKKNVYENYENFLSGKYITKLLNVEMNDKTLYSNIINIIHAVVRDLIINGEYGNFFSFADFMNAPVTKYMLTSNHFKSTLNDFVTMNQDFWAAVIRIDNLFENRTISDKCLPYGNDTSENLWYMNAHAAYHIALQDYLHFVKEQGDQLKKQTELLAETGLNHSKAYMLALAQEKCADYETQKLDDDDKLIMFFKHSKQFSDTWGCAAGDPMHQVCDDSSFVPNF